MPEATEGIRTRNLARVLGLVHGLGPLSRAELTRHTGLNRSTIADLVASLSEGGWLTERAPDPAGRAGRPSPVVAASPDVLCIAVNPEVDAVTIGAVRIDQSIAIRERIETEGLISPAETVDLITSTIDRWRENMPSTAWITSVGVAVPGLVRGEDGAVRTAPHLGWRDVPLGPLISARTGLPTAVDNDATLGAIAEHLYGAARGVDDVVYLNGGASGIGGGLIVHGMPVRGASGYAGEFGHNRPHVARSDEGGGTDAALEDEVSRARLLDAVGLHGADEATLAQALAGSTDPGVIAEMARQRRILATALSNAVNVLNPSRIVLGGFLATLADPDPADLVDLVRAQSMPGAAADVDIRTAALAEDRLLIGAAEAAFAPLLSDPLRDRAPGR
ncbi:ROK family transcriptional regulator [Microbacterium sediminicola]|uniref:ROK family transcriptional regulator n=1 Tax=Microbacterium sediminicola TaxID=415210 RepID=A0ABP4UMS4_9MICO